MHIDSEKIKRILYKIGGTIYPFPVDNVNVEGDKVKISFRSSSSIHPFQTVVRDRNEVIEHDIMPVYEKEQAIAGMEVDCDLLGIEKVGFGSLYKLTSSKINELEDKFRKGIKPYLNGYQTEMPRCVVTGSGMQADIMFQPYISGVEVKTPIDFEERREKAISEKLKERLGISF